MDKRHLERIKIVQNLFAASFPDLKDNLPYEDSPVSREIMEKHSEIDSYITICAPKFPIDRIAKADLAILRLAVYELLIKPDEPYKVVINEAVELAKEFAGERSYAFVNAVLGTLVKNYVQKNEEGNEG
jgi:transcription antitermination protein NusB